MRFYINTVLSDNNWCFFNFDTFSQNKEENAIGRLFKRVWTCQPNLILLFPSGGLSSLLNEPDGRPEWQDLFLSIVSLLVLVSIDTYR